MTTVNWNKLSLKDKNKFIHKLFPSCLLNNPAGDLNQLFILLKQYNLPFQIFLNTNGDIWAGVRDSQQHNFGAQISALDAGCLAVLKYFNIEQAIQVIPHHD